MISRCHSFQIVFLKCCFYFFEIHKHESVNLFIQIWIGSSIKVPFFVKFVDVNHTRDCIALNFYSWVISSESNRLVHDQFHFWAKSFSLFNPKFRFNFEITNSKTKKNHLHNTRFTVDLSRQWVNVIVKTKEIINNLTNGPKQRIKSAKKRNKFASVSISYN